MTVVKNNAIYDFGYVNDSIGGIDVKSFFVILYQYRRKEVGKLTT